MKREAQKSIKMWHPKHMWRIQYWMPDLYAKKLILQNSTAAISAKWPHEEKVPCEIPRKILWEQIAPFLTHMPWVPVKKMRVPYLWHGPHISTTSCWNRSTRVPRFVVTGAVIDPHASPSLAEVRHCCGILKWSVSVLKLSKGARPVGSKEALCLYVLYFFLFSFYNRFLILFV